jgi:hypothetical protein
MKLRATPQIDAAQQKQVAPMIRANRRNGDFAGSSRPKASGTDFSNQRLRHMLRLKMLGMCVALSTVVANPALASDNPGTRLVKCGTGNCLKVSGQRAGKNDSVLINGHEVAAKGARRWHVSLPVDTVRTWSAPYARTISVTIAGATHAARLPIGMMGHADLAMLVVRVK